MPKKPSESWDSFLKVAQKSGTVKLALRDDADFRKWYKTKRKR